MIVGVILLRTERQFNGWQGQAKGRNGECGTVERCLACEAVGVATLERRHACEDVVSSKYSYENRIESALHFTVSACFTQMSAARRGGADRIGLASRGSAPRFAVSLLCGSAISWHTPLFF
jgi:hypothetical protein